MLMKTIDDSRYFYDQKYELNGLEDNLFYIPNQYGEQSRSDLVIKFFPENSKPWVGVLSFDNVLPSGKTIFLEGPGQHKLSVICKGSAFIVDVNNPESVTNVKCCPIRGAFHIKSSNILIFHDDTEVFAYDENGLLWITKRLSWDGIKIKKIDEYRIYGTSWDSPKNKYVDFSINISTGKHIGGASP